MLRAAAAATAWLFIPICGYVLGVFYYSSTANRAGSKAKQQQSTMIYQSRAALPSEWDKRQWGRHQTVQQYLKVDGLAVKYVGPGETDAQAASIFADHPVPHDVPLYYFEVTIVSKGDNGYIGIGFCSDDVDLGRLPGWEPHSYGYHGDDGHAFHGSGMGRAFGPRFTTGDIVGALLDRGTNTISFYKNGESVGTAFYDVQEPQLYPCVGMRTANEELRANFGAAPFAVDLTRLQSQFRSSVLQAISAVPLPVAVDLQTPPPAAAGAAGAVGAAAGGLGPSRQGLAAAPVAAATGAAGARAAAAAGDGEGGDRLEPAARAILAAMGAEDAAAAAVDRDAGDGDAEPGAAAAAAGGAAAAPGRWSQPLLPYLIFDYLLHQRCWRTAAIVARDMLGGSTSSSTGAAAAGAAAAAAGDTAAPMECSGSDDQAMTDAAPAAAAPGPSSSTATAADAAAAAAAVGAAGALSEADIQDALRRQQIFDAVCAGQLVEALAQVTASYGAVVLTSNPRLAFKLKVQQFIELVRQAASSSSSSDTCAVADAAGAASNGSAGTADAAAAAAAAASAAAGDTSSTMCFEAALAYGRAELGPIPKTPADEELLADALSLLAYGDPGSSPCGHLMRPGQRVLLAEELNGALLKARGTSAQPLLESMYRQAVVLLDELKRQGLPAALVLDVPGLCLTRAAAGAQKGQKGQASSSAAAAAAARREG